MPSLLQKIQKSYHNSYLYANRRYGKYTHRRPFPNFSDFDCSPSGEYSVAGDVDLAADVNQPSKTQKVQTQQNYSTSEYMDSSMMGIPNSSSSSVVSHSGEYNSNNINEYSRSQLSIADTSISTNTTSSSIYYPKKLIRLDESGLGSRPYRDNDQVTQTQTLRNRNGKEIENCYVNKMGHHVYITSTKPDESKTINHIINKNKQQLAHQSSYSSSSTMDPQNTYTYNNSTTLTNPTSHSSMYSNENSNPVYHQSDSMEFKNISLNEKSQNLQSISTAYSSTSLSSPIRQQQLSQNLNSKSLNHPNSISSNSSSPFQNISSTSSITESQKLNKTASTPNIKIGMPIQQQTQIQNKRYENHHSVMITPNTTMNPSNPFYSILNGGSNNSLMNNTTNLNSTYNSQNPSNPFSLMKEPEPLMEIDSTTNITSNFKQASQKPPLDNPFKVPDLPTTTSTTSEARRLSRQRHRSYQSNLQENQTPKALQGLLNPSLSSNVPTKINPQDSNTLYDRLKPTQYFGNSFSLDLEFADEDDELNEQIFTRNMNRFSSSSNRNNNISTITTTSGTLDQSNFNSNVMGKNKTNNNKYQTYTNNEEDHDDSSSDIVSISSSSQSSRHQHPYYSTTSNTPRNNGHTDSDAFPYHSNYTPNTLSNNDITSSTTKTTKSKWWKKFTPKLRKKYVVNQMDDPTIINESNGYPNTIENNSNGNGYSPYVNGPNQRKRKRKFFKHFSFKAYL